MRRNWQWSSLLQTSITASFVLQKQGFTTGLLISSRKFPECDELVIKLCRQSRSHEALAVIASLDPSIIILSRDALYHLLQSCLETKDLLTAQKVHCLIISNGLEFTTVLLDHLIRLFAFCGSLSASYQVFLKVSATSVYTWNAILSAHTQLKEFNRALALFDYMQKNVEILPDKITYLCALQADVNAKNVDLGRVVHGRIVSEGLDSDIAIGSSLVHVYAQCGYLQDMQQVFDVLPNHDVISWGVIVSAYAQYGHDEVVIDLFKALQKEGVQPDRGMYVSFLKSCSVLGDLENGRMFHDHIRGGCLEGDILLQSTLIDMYSACRNLKEACDVFDKMMIRDLVAWAAIMSACIHNHHFLSALILYESMQQEGLQPDSVIFLCVIKACSSLGDLVLGRVIHEQVINHNLEMHIMVGNTLLDFYTKCGTLEEASNVFDHLSTHDLVSWNIMLAAYVDNGLVDDAFRMFNKMELKGLSPSNVSFICMLRTCGMVSSPKLGRLIHDKIIRNGFESDVAIKNSIVDMYAKCQTLHDARKAFQTFANQGVVTWTALLSGFAQGEDGFHVLNLFAEMLQTGIILDEVIFLSALSACGSLHALREGWLLNDKLIRSGMESRTVVGNSLVCMYAKCGSLKESHKVFKSLPSKDVVSWGAMIGGYAQQGQGYTALVLFKNMLEEGICPDQATLICALKACGSVQAAMEGRCLHDLIFRSEFVLDNVVGNALLDMYFRCGSLLQAHKVFDNLESRDIVSWTTLIVGYAQHGHGFTALKLYKNLQQEGLQPTRVLCLCVLQACVTIGAVDAGSYVYEDAKYCGLIPDMAISNSFVELHAQWGDLEGAEKAFKSLPHRDVTTWTVLMAGYAACGNYRQVMNCLIGMQQEGLEPDYKICTVILSACRNAGLLKESLVILKSMVDHHHITPDLEHYSCMIDVLGRVGRQDEGFKLLQTLPNPLDNIAWQSLLVNSRIYGNTGSWFLSIDDLQEVEGTKASVCDNVDGQNMMMALEEINRVEINRVMVGSASMLEVINPEEGSCFEAAGQGNCPLKVNIGQVPFNHQPKQVESLARYGTIPKSNNVMESIDLKFKQWIKDSSKLLDVGSNQGCNKGTSCKHVLTTNRNEFCTLMYLLS